MCEYDVCWSGRGGTVGPVGHWPVSSGISVRQVRL